MAKVLGFIVSRGVRCRMIGGVLPEERRALGSACAFREPERRSAQGSRREAACRY